MTGAHVIFVTDDRTAREQSRREFSDLPEGTGVIKPSVVVDEKYNEAVDAIKTTVKPSAVWVRRLQCAGRHVVCSTEGLMFGADGMHSLSPGERVCAGRYQSAPDVYVTVYIVAEEE